MRRLSFLASAALVSCGGGGGPAGTSVLCTSAACQAANAPKPAPAPSPAPSPTPAPAPSPSPSGALQGLYIGTASSGYDFGVVALETNEVWGIYSKGGVIYGAVHGGASVTGSSFSGNGFDFNLATGTRTATSFSGSFSPSSSVNGTLAPSHVTFTGVYDSAYNTPATLSTITGSWVGQVASASGLQNSSINVATDGSFRGLVSSCSYTGSVAPRPGGKGVFNMSVAFGSSGCLFNGQSLSGFAMVRSGQLITLGLLPDGSNGFMALAHRP